MLVGGVLRRAGPAAPGPATWAIIVAMLTSSTTISTSVFLSVASGIENELKVRKLKVTKLKGKRRKFKGGF
jgi:hypothetical protein